MNEKLRRTGAMWATARVAKSLTIAVLLLMVASGMCWGADDPTSPEASYAVGRRDKLFAVHFIDQTIGFAAGNKGLLLKTADGGARWKKVDCGRSYLESFNAIDFAGQDGWVVGGNGLILHTADAGESWQQQVSGTTEALMAVTCASPREVVVVGSAGLILLTGDAGKSWSMPELDWLTVLPESIIAMGVTAPNLYDVCFVDALHGWIVGDNGLVLRSDNGGKAWNLLTVGVYPSLYSACFTTAFEGLVVGQEGYLLSTVDGGATWEGLPLPPEAAALTLYKIAIKNTAGLIVGDRGLILRSTDGGKGWQRVALDVRPPLPWFSDVCITSHNSPCEVVVAGQNTIQRVLIGRQ